MSKFYRPRNKPFFNGLAGDYLVENAENGWFFTFLSGDRRDRAEDTYDDLVKNGSWVETNPTRELCPSYNSDMENLFKMIDVDPKTTETIQKAILAIVVTALMNSNYQNEVFDLAEQVVLKPV